jgi:hypothetical protein
MNKMPFISFKKLESARTGNCIFQYLTCKLFSLLHGHVYVPHETFGGVSALEINDSNFMDLLKDDSVKSKDLICVGYFQISEPFVRHRDALLAHLRHSPDFWFEGSEKRYICDFLHKPPPFYFEPRDVLISFRLDDFIQLPCPTSDIVPPQYYLDILDSLYFDRLFIVMDKIRHPWELKYIEFFKKWSPFVLQNSLLEDAAIIRSAPFLIHSNSTFCWIMSFFSSAPKVRYIPRTNFYKGQNLGIIEKSDILTNVHPMFHSEISKLNVNNLEVYNYLPLPYAIPDEYVVAEIPTKTNECVDMMVSKKGQNRFGPGEEDAYLQTYKDTCYAITKKRGGWDCLRHYEILASGAIPEFENLEECPKNTMISFPKSLLKEAYADLASRKDDKFAYNYWANKLLDFSKKHITTSVLAKYFLSKFEFLVGKKITKILILYCNASPNYSREFLTIGLSRAVEEVVCYPEPSYLYKGNAVDKATLHGNGFCYSDRLNLNSSHYNEHLIRESIDSKYWDLVIYGKMGPDEGPEGTYSSAPFWENVSKKYSKERIVFIYGGDNCYNFSVNNKYRKHLEVHNRLGTCFVRELQCLPFNKRNRIGVAIGCSKKDLGVLTRCLDSIESQTQLPDIVAISVSGCAPSDINLKKYSFLIHVFTISESRATAIDRNNAWRMIEKEADYVTFIEPNNSMLPRRIEFLDYAFKTQHCDFIVTNFVTRTSESDGTMPWINNYDCYKNSLIMNPDTYGGVILKDELKSTLKNAEIQNGQVSVRANIPMKIREDPCAFNSENSLFNKELLRNGYSGCYLYTQLSVYNCY